MLHDVVLSNVIWLNQYKPFFFPFFFLLHLESSYIHFGYVLLAGLPVVASRTSNDVTFDLI